MYEIEGICYAGEEMAQMEVERIKILDDGMLLVTFSTGETRLFDVTSLVSKGPAFAPLCEEKNRRTAKVTFGFVSWLDGKIDIANETLYKESFKYTEKTKCQN